MIFFWFKEEEEPLKKLKCNMILLVCLHTSGIFFAGDKRIRSNVFHLEFLLLTGLLWCEFSIFPSKKPQTELYSLLGGEGVGTKQTYALLSLHSNCFTVLLWHSGSACTLPDEMLCVNWFRESVQLKVRLTIRWSLQLFWTESQLARICFQMLLPSI